MARLAEELAMLEAGFQSGDRVRFTGRMLPVATGRTALAGAAVTFGARGVVIGPGRKHPQAQGQGQRARVRSPCLDGLGHASTAWAGENVPLIPLQG